MKRRKFIKDTSVVAGLSFAVNGFSIGTSSFAKDKMRQVAVDAQYQSKGVGSFLVAYSESYSVTIGFKKIELHARDTAINFYKKAGYETEGPIFKEVGIDHLFMYKNLV